MKLQTDPRDPSTFNYDILAKHVLKTCVTPNALTLQDVEGEHTVPGVSSCSPPAGVPLPQMPVVVNLLAIPNKEAAAPV